MKNKINISINLDEISDDLKQSVKFLVENKVNFAEVRMINHKNIVNYDLQDSERIAKYLAKNGLKVSAIASPLFKWYLNPRGNKILHDNFSFEASLSTRQKKDYILKAIKIANIFKTKNIRVFSNLRQDGIKILDLFEDKVFDFMLNKFAEFGVNPLLENELVCLISNANDYINTLKKFESIGLRAWWDIANSYESGDLVNEELINKLKTYIKYIHLKDESLLTEKVYVPLGDGSINYKRILTDLTNILTEDTFTSIETHVKKNRCIATRKSLKYLRNLLSEKRIPYALVGAGKISRNHALAFKQNLNSELRGVFDINGKKAKLFARENDIKVYKSLKELISDPNIKVVNICTPHDTHINIAKKVISANKIVLSEKPFAINSRKLSNYLKNREASKNTYVVFQNLFNKPVQELLSINREGKIGKIQFFAANIRWGRSDSYFNDWHGKLKASGGSLFNQAIHTLEIINEIAGKSIKKVSYVKKIYRKNSEVEDVGIASFKLSNGGVGYLELCLINKGGNLESSFYVTGNKGSIKIDGLSLNNLIFEHCENIKKNNKKEEFKEIYGNGHTILIKTLSNKLLGEKDKNVKYLVKAKEILPTILLIEKLYERY